MGAQGDGTNLMPGGCFRHKKRQTLWGVCRLVQASGPVSRVLSSGVCQTDGHLSGTSVTRYLVQPTRASKRGGSPLRSYSALLRMGFAVPPPSPGTRWALTPPFHPCPQPRRARPAGGLFSVALSVGLPRLGVTQHPALWSSDFPHPNGRGHPAHLPIFPPEFPGLPTDRPHDSRTWEHAGSGMRRRTDRVFGLRRIRVSKRVS